MKKVNFKSAILAFVVTLAFVFVGVEQADAQVTPELTTMHGGAYNVPTGDFVSSTDAQDIVFAEMLSLKEDVMPTQTGAPLDANIMLVSYYGGILASLESGQTVPQSIVDGLSGVLGSNLEDSPEPAVLLALKQIAIDLLDI